MIRRRINLPSNRKYPSPRFVGYCYRFGQIEAAFLSPKFQRGFDLKGPGEAAVLMYSKAGLTQEMLNRKDNNQNFLFMKDVLDKWPRRSDHLTALPTGLDYLN